MGELVGRLVAGVGIDRAAAEHPVRIIPDFLAREGPPDKLKSFMAKLRGADAPCRRPRPTTPAAAWAA